MSRSISLVLSCGYFPDNLTLPVVYEAALQCDADQDNGFIVYTDFHLFDLPLDHYTKPDFYIPRSFWEDADSDDNYYLELAPMADRIHAYAMGADPSHRERLNDMSSACETFGIVLLPILF